MRFGRGGFWAAALGALALAGCAPAEDDDSSDSGRTFDPGEQTLGMPRPRPPLGEFPPAQDRLPQIDLEIAAQDLARLEANPYSDDMVPAVMAYDGHTAPAQVRFRGASSRGLPQKSFKVDLAKGFRLDGRDRFRLLAEYMDSGKLTEKFAIDLFVAMGLETPWGQYVRVSVNGKPNGVYLDMEHVGGEYLAATGKEESASIYRCGGRNCELKDEPPGSYQQGWEKTRGDPADTSDLAELLRIVDRTDVDDFEQQIAAVLDLDAYLGNLAGDALISNNILEDARPYFVHEPLRDVWTYVPWDLNNAMALFYRTWAVTDPPIVKRDARSFTIYDPMIEKIWAERNKNPAYRPTWSVLNTRIWDSPELRGRLLDKLEWALAGPFSEERALAHVDALWRAVGDAVLTDPFADVAHARVASDFLKRYVKGRRAHLAAQLPALRAHGSGELVINELGFASGANPGYVELFNRGAAARTVSGLAITDDLRSPLKQILGAGLSIPPGGRLVLVADGNPSAGPEHLAFTLPPGKGGAVGLFDGTHVWGPLDALWHGPHAGGTAYGRSQDGAERFLALPQTPGAPNR